MNENLLSTLTYKNQIHAMKCKLIFDIEQKTKEVKTYKKLPYAHCEWGTAFDVITVHCTLVPIRIVLGFETIQGLPFLRLDTIVNGVQYNIGIPVDDPT